MTEQTTAHYLLEGLAEIGIEYLFSNLGTDYATVIEEMARWQRLGRPHPKVIICPHEVVAMHMAGGYAMCTGRGQAVLAHVDSGTANASMSVQNLARTRVPVLLVAGRAPYTLRGELPGSRDTFVHFVQEPFDLTSLVRPYIKWDYNLPSGLVVKESLRRAHTVMHSDPAGPVYFTMAREVLAQTFDDASIRSFPADRYGPVRAGGVDDDTIEEIADRLLAAHDPVLITAYAGRNAEAPGVIDALARLTGMRVYESNPLHLNIPRNSPCFSGFLAGRGIADADLVLLVDVDVPWIPRLARENPSSFVIHVDIDPLKKDMAMWGFPTNLRLQADSTRVLTKLLARIEARACASYRRSASQRTARWGELRREADRALAHAATLKGSPGRIAVPYLFAELAKVMQPDDILVNESISNAITLLTQIPRTRPGTFLGNGSSGLGFGGGVALGARLARPDRTVFHVTGDGSFVFSSPEAVYATSQMYGLPIFTLVLDNAGWNAVRAATLRVHPEGEAKAAGAFCHRLFEGMRLEKVAEAAGVYGERVENPNDVPAALARCLAVVKGGRSAVLVASIDREPADPLAAA